MYRDYLADLGLTTGKQSEGIENIILNYKIDDSSLDISKGNIITFVGDNIRKMIVGDMPMGIALQNGIKGDIIKVQIMGIVKLKSFFVAGANYFNTETGELSDLYVIPSGNVKHIGLAITTDEMLIKRGAFIYV